MDDRARPSSAEQLAAQAAAVGARARGAIPRPSRARCGPTGSGSAGIVGSYREAAGITDPAQAIGPVPSGQAHLAEAFRASVRALQLPDDAALLKAMGQGELEARGRRARPGHGPGPGRRPGRDRRAGGRAARTPRSAPTSPAATGTLRPQAEAEARGPGRRRGPGPARRG